MIYAFTPTANEVFQFQPSLDGALYTCIITWNIYGQRWYFNLYTVQGVLVVAAALVGSPPDADINLIGGYFATSRMVFRQASQTFEVTP